MRRLLPLLVALALAACGAQQPPNAPVPPVAPPPAAQSPARTFFLEGRVLSDLDESVVVSLAAVDSMPPCWDGPRVEVLRRSAMVAPGETFRFEGLNAGVYWIQGSSTSSSVWEYDTVTVVADVRDYEIRVRPACRVVGHVSLRDGIRREDCWIDWGQRNTSTSLGRGVPANGRFTIERLEPGPTTLFIHHWPESDSPARALRVERRVDVERVAGDNEVELLLDAESPAAK